MKRDMRVHIEGGVNLKRTWKVVKEDIFDLRTRILKVKENLGGNNSIPSADAKGGYEPWL